MSSPLTPRQKIQQAQAEKHSHNVVTNEPNAHPVTVGRRGSLSKSLVEHHDPTSDPITHKAKSPEAVPKTPGKDSSAHRVHTPFTQGSAHKAGFDIITGSSNADKAASPKDAVLSPRRAKEQPVAPYDPVTNLELKHPPASGDKKISHGYYKKEMQETHTNVDPITGSKVEPAKPLVSAGSFRRELAQNGVNVDPITGNFKAEPVKSPSNSNFKRQAMEQASSTAASAASSNYTAYDPVTGQESSHAPRPGSSMGQFRKEMVETHQNVDPITGAKVTPFKPNGPSHGAIKAELLRQGVSGNPIV